VKVVPPKAAPPQETAATPRPKPPAYGAELYDALTELGITAGKEILDVGCGSGTALEPLVARGCVVTGLDPASEEISVARERYPDIKLLQGTAEQLPFPENSFDGAICAQAFHLFDQQLAMSELLRVVRPGRPVAIWWSVLSTTERAREAHEHASLRAKRPPMPDPNKGGFKAFFSAPFADRRVRVTRHIVFTTVDQWITAECARATVRERFGPQFEPYLVELEKELRDSYGDGEMQATFVQYLYVGLVP
jgi:ubiquinone/menaquinone biosynthesis C-methylase UbiE